MERALREKPDLGDETIAVVFFLDPGLDRCQQMFADLNRYAIRPSKSLSILYDHRDYTAQLTKALIAKSPAFRDLVELEKTSLAPRSRRLFTLSALYHATAELLAGMEDEPQHLAELAVSYWESVASRLPEWQRVRLGELSAGEVRMDYIHTHGVVLQALGRVGNVLLVSARSSGRRSSLPLSGSTGAGPTAPSGRVAPSQAAGSQRPARASSSQPTSSRRAFAYDLPPRNRPSRRPSTEVPTMSSSCPPSAFAAAGLKETIVAIESEIAELYASDAVHGSSATAVARTPQLSCSSSGERFLRCRQHGVARPST